MQFPFPYSTTINSILKLGTLLENYHSDDGDWLRTADARRKISQQNYSRKFSPPSVYAFIFITLQITLLGFLIVIIEAITI